MVLKEIRTWTRFRLPPARLLCVCEQSEEYFGGCEALLRVSFRHSSTVSIVARAKPSGFDSVAANWILAMEEEEEEDCRRCDLGISVKLRTFDIG